MKNSSIIGIIILFILVYAIIAIGIAAAVIGIAIGLYYIIKWSIRYVHDFKLKKTKKELLYKSLIHQYHIIENFENNYNIDNKLRAAISQILSNQIITPELIQGFGRLKSIFYEAINKSSVWYNKSPLKNYSYSSSSLERYNFFFQEKGFLDIGYSPEDPFLLKTNNHSFYFYPNFIISEVNCEYKIVDYNDISIQNINTIYVAEQSGKIIKGASPVYYNYLHERVGGGPDRRYKNNPSIPVYLHTIYTLNIDEECQIISSNNDSAEMLKNALKQYQLDLISNNMDEVKVIQDLNLSSNEYATRMREIICKYGNNIINDKLFIYLLKDYKFSREYPYLIPIYESLQQNNFMKNLVEENCEYSYLDELRAKLSQTSTYSKEEIVSALAFLGYGLQINDR